MRTWAYVLAAMALAAAPGAYGAGMCAQPGKAAPPRAPSARAAQTAESSEAEVAGTVTDASTGQPLNGASVELVPARDAESGPVVVRMEAVGGGSAGSPRAARTSTNADGRFVFADAQPGEYRLRVWHNGYAGQGYEGRVAGDPGRKLTLDPGAKVTDLRIALTPAGVVTGRVTDQDGSPLPWVIVRVLASSYDAEGVKRVFPVGSASTDDRGIYRVFGLAPGQYYVDADYEPGREGPGFGGAAVERSDAASTAQAYPQQLFYPGVTDPANASKVSVVAGQETAEIDFSLNQSAVYQVSGKVTPAAGAGARGPKIMTFAVAEDSPGAEVRQIFLGGGNVRLVPQGAENMGLRPYFASIVRGQFRFQDVPSGSYTLIASQTGPRGQSAVGQIPVAVTGNVTGLDVALQPGMELAGQVSVEGQSSTGNSSRSVSVFLRPTGALVGVGNAYGMTRDGKIVLTGVFPGSYWVGVGGLPAGAYVKSVRLGTQDALTKPLEIPSGGTSDSLSVVVALDGAQVSGTVLTGSNQPAGGATVVLVPDAPLRGVSALYRVTTTDQNGNFSLEGIRPGAYTLFAWAEVTQGAWFDPAFLKTAEGMGKGIELGEGQRATVTLEQIAAAVH